MITIRRALPHDAQTLAALSATTYAQTFNYYPPEDLEHYLSTTYTTENYLAYLADPSTSIWLAEDTDDGTPLGYVMAGPAGLPHPDCSDQDGELKRLYVLADQQGSGLGTRLLETALEWLEGEYPHRSLWLGVWSENYGAQRLYSRYGFKRVGDYYFEVGSTRDFEFIFRRDPR